MTRKHPNIVNQSEYLAKVLIVDEIGLPVDKITNDLLSRGCLVYLATKLKPEDNPTLQKPNLFILQPKDINTVSLLDYLIIVEKQTVKEPYNLDKYPKAYRTAAFCRYQDKPNVSATDNLQLVCYEEIVDPSIENKFYRLMALRNEGNRIILVKGGNYYPVTPFCLGEMIGRIVAGIIREKTIWLQTGNFQWSALVQQINRIGEKRPKREIAVELPDFSVQSGWSVVTIPSDFDTIVKKELSPSIETLPDQSIASLMPNTKKANITLRTLIRKSSWTKFRPLAGWLLLLINLFFLGRFLTERVVATDLSRYRQNLSVLSGGNNYPNPADWNELTKSANRLNFWQSRYLGWLLSSKTKLILPLQTANQSLLSLIDSLKEYRLNGSDVTKRWLAGEMITQNNWDTLESTGLQTTEWLLTANQRIDSAKHQTAGNLGIDDELKLFLTNWDLKLNKEREAIRLWKALLTDNPRRILVLIQNNYELRPTGGLVSAYGVLTLKNGQKPSANFADSSALDAKTVGRIQPPAEVVNHLGENTWYFRDINWDPDLALSANRAIWYFENTDKSLVDGVLVTDTDFWFNLDKWLRNREEVDKNQFYADLVEVSADQKGTFSAGRYLADFANGVFERMVLRSADLILNGNENTPANVSFADIFYQLAENKSVALYMKDIQIEKILAVLGWDGKVKKFAPPASKSEIVADYLMINEANVGVNLVNRFIVRRIEQEVGLTGGKNESLINLVYRNNSSLTGWPGGTYQAYVRVYLPKTVGLISISAEKRGQKEYVDPAKVNGSQFDDKAVFGWRIEVPPGETVKYIIKYNNQGFNSLEKIGTYLLMVQKQPGVEPYDYSLTVKSDRTLVPLRSIPSGTISTGSVRVDNRITGDQIFQVDFGQ